MTTVSVFGGTGFLGQRLVRRLASEGVAVRVAVRHADQARTALGAAGMERITVFRADVRDRAAVAGAVAGADAVVNAVSAYVETGGVTFEAVHEQGAETLAREAARAGVARFVLVSGIGADPESGSAYIRSRGRGERVVREAFPSATIVRPSAMFGPGDALFGTLAHLARLLPVLPLIGGGHTRLQPVFVEDVAEAIARILADPSTAGRTYELAGPAVYTCASWSDRAAHHRQTSRARVGPVRGRRPSGALVRVLPNPPLTTGQVDLLKADNVASGTLPGLRELDIMPKAVEEIVPTYLKEFCADQAMDRRKRQAQSVDEITLKRVAVDRETLLGCQLAAQNVRGDRTIVVLDQAAPNGVLQFMQRRHTRPRPFPESTKMHLCLRSLVQQYVERRNVGVPFDQGRHCSKALQRARIQGPDGGSNARAVVIDAQHLVPSMSPNGCARQMDLADCVGRQRIEVSRCVPAVIAGTDVDVVDVAQDAAARALADVGQEFPLRDGRALELQIRRRVLDQDSALEIRLGPIDVATDETECFFRHRQRQQVGQVIAVHDGPREMFGHQTGFEALNGDTDALKVRVVDSLGAAERQSDAVQRQRIIFDE